jgi:hypothetical protein
MFKVFQSIFGGGERKGAAYPPALVEAAIDRALDATDPRIRAVSGHRKRLQPAVIHAIDHVVALVEAMPAPVEASAASYGSDARLSSFFASTDRMAEVFGADRALIEFLASAGDPGTGPILAVLFVERSEKKVLGMAVQGDQVMQEVSQVQVSFDKHRLVDPSATEEELRKKLRHRAFDHLLSMALTRIVEVGNEREALEQSQSMLRAKLRALQSARFGFSEEGGENAEPAALEAKLAEIEGKLAETGSGATALPRHLELLVESLAAAEKQLYAEPVTVLMDRLGIRQGTPGPTTVELQLRELHNAVGHAVVSLPIAIPRSEIRKRDIEAEVRRALL